MFSLHTRDYRDAMQRCFPKRSRAPFGQENVLNQLQTSLPSFKLCGILVVVVFFYTSNGPFPSYHVPLFQTESIVQNLSHENELDLQENQPVGGRGETMAQR